MWVLLRRVPNLMVAEMWKDLLEDVGIALRVVPDPDSPGVGERAPRQIWVPERKDYVAEEVLRKI